MKCRKKLTFLAAFLFFHLFRGSALRGIEKTIEVEKEGLSFPRRRESRIQGKESSQHFAADSKTYGFPPERE